jgi:hypothetical protein
VPVGTPVPGRSTSSSSASAYSSTLLTRPGTLNAVSGPHLTSSGKPEILYVATEYCPYCAVENWPLIVALSRKSGLTPFLDFGNRAVQIGSGPIPPQLMTGTSRPQLAAALRQPKTDLGAALLTEADSLTAELCRLTGNRPASACPEFLRNAGPLS